jgi:hypothetical protein
MTGLLAGPLTDPAGLGAVRADLASVVPEVLEPARLSLRISHCDRDWLTRTAAGASDHRLIVASIVSRRRGRMFSQLACGTGNHAARGIMRHGESCGTGNHAARGILWLARMLAPV